MKMLNIATTIIDFGVKPEAILSRSMPPEIQSLIKSTDAMRSSGFQEVLGYKGRKLILSAGGSWDGKKFIVDSVGGILNGEHIYWKKGGKVERVNKKSNKAGVEKQSSEGAPKELIGFLKDIQAKIPKAIKELETGNYGRSTSVTSFLVGKLIRTPQEDWYTEMFE